MPRRGILLSRIETVATALQLSLVLALALMAFVLGPKIRTLMHESGRPLGWDVRLVVAPAWWPACLGIAVLLTAIAFVASGRGARRFALASAMALSVGVLVASTAVLADKVRLRDLIEAGNPLGPRDTDNPVPRQLDPDR